MKTRIKLRSFPGDIPMGQKFQLLKNHKGYRKTILMRRRAIENRLAQKVIEEQSE